MMQVIRDKAQGIVAWVIVGIIAFVLCFWGVSGYINSNKSKVLAKVDGKEITAAEVNNIYNRWLHVNAAQPDFDVSQVDPNVVKTQITKGLAQQSATINSLLKDGMSISEDMIIESIRTRNELQVDSKFSMERYQMLLRETGMTESEFANLVRDQLLVNQLQIAVQATSFTTPNEVEHVVAMRNQKRDFGYALISAEKFLKGVKITDSAVSEFYESHQGQFLVPEKVQIEYIQLAVEDILPAVKVDEQKLQSYYSANQQSFVQPKKSHLRHIMILAPDISVAATSGEAQKQIEDIYVQLQNGADFSELAKKHSEDKLSATKGGDLGWAQPSDDYPAEVFLLQNNGEYTKPLQTEYGWHIFQLVESQGGNVRSFNEVRNTVAERYRFEEAQRLFSTKGEELANIVFENPGSLTAASEQLNLPIKNSDYFSVQGGEGIAAANNVVKAAFSNDVLVQKNNSELIRLNDDNYVVLRIKDKQPAHAMTLDEARSDIVNILQSRAAKEEAASVGAEFLEAVKQNNNPNKAASNQNLEWNAEQNVERDNRIISQEIIQRAFAMPKPDKEPTTAGFSLANGDYVVIAVSKVEDGKLNTSDDSTMLETVSKQLAIFYGQIEYAAMQESLIEHAKIKYLN